MALFAAGCGQPRSSERVEWMVMGTVAAFQCRSHADIAKADKVKAIFAEVERLLNAHDPESELNRLASRDNGEILEQCNPKVRPCYEAAFRYRDLSGGVFNPRYRGEGTMDLGGIAKGFALDLAAAEIGECDALVDLGGNLKALGGEWRIGVYGDVKNGMVVLRKGESCSTSGEYFRGKHIKDGRSGRDFSSSAYSVTVIHPDSAMDADALSTILYILGPEKGEGFLSTLGNPAIHTIWLGR